jgi:DamX protein
VAISELQHRLEHLVSYSSQLIFVSGDSIAQQQKSLQAFLGQQSENTEIAFVNGETDATKQSYRKQIKEQLLGVGPGLFNRPLNELLAPLNHHAGPVLICICQAEKIPSDLLQELWDLVLQSRL